MFEGQRRQVLVGVDSIEMTGVWSVYDVPLGGKHTHGWLVQRLDGHDDKLLEAAALARAYAADQEHLHDVLAQLLAKANPLPRPIVDESGKRHPVEVRLAEIRKDAELARRQATPDPQPIAA
jgi:hypothetical protein